MVWVGEKDDDEDECTENDGGLSQSTGTLTAFSFIAINSICLVCYYKKHIAIINVISYDKSYK